MATITFIGGGSAKFIAELVRDIYLFDELRSTHIRLMDIDEVRVKRSEKLVQKIIADMKLPASVSSTTDQRRAIAGTDYVVVTVMVGGFKHYETDGTIPMKYGLLPTVGDTIGPGGVFRLVRTAPVLEQIAKNVRETAPHAWVLNYSNPMAMNIWTLLDYGQEKCVGLCHSIQGAYRLLAEWLDIPADEIQYTAGGINHVDFYLKLEHKGKDLYPLLLANKDRIMQLVPATRAKFELLEHLGYWPAEGDFHQNEYYSWFNRNRAMAKEYDARTMWGFHRDQEKNIMLVQKVEDQIAGRAPIELERGLEYGSYIIHSLETGQPRLFYGNVRNHGLIENLPPEAAVEVPCHVNADGIRPCRVGRIPPQLAAVIAPHIAVHGMAIEAVKRKDRRLIHQAIQADPLTAAVMTLPRIRQMVDELFVENAEYVKDWR